ncbi:hypothetical protein IH992_21125, partial [Candidatus Poribacteria bacterium]|nr:hypothetical protein [Candidatus Poribacteria bacterium]
MLSKLATIVFLTLMAISWTTTATAAERTEAQVHQLNEAIQKLEHALERATTAEKKLELKGALQEYRQKLEELMAGSDEAREFEGEFSEIEMAIRNTEGQLEELRHAAEILGDEGGEPEKLEKLQQQIARREAQLEELTAHFERRERGEEREHEGRERQIRQVKGAIQELRHALEHRPDSEKVEQWRASLMEYEQQLEWLTAEHDEGREHRGEFPEIEMAIERARGQLEELAHAAEDLQETGSAPDKLESIRKRIHQKERELEELFGLRERRRHEAARRGERPPGELVIFRLKHTEAGDLGEVIEKFLTSSGTI